MSRRRVLVVSPHFDDVPLSLGQSLTDGALAACEVTVHVAFARTNWTRWMHPTPGRARPVGWWRRAEEALAARRFGYRWRAGRWQESMLRTGELDPAVFLDPDAELGDDALLEELAGWLRTLVRARPVDLVLVSAGLGGHVDHRLVAAAAHRAGELGVPVGFYEDRPYASHLDDATLRHQLAHLGPDPDPVEVSGPVQESTHRRVRRCYPSQIDAYFVQAMERDRSRGAVERVWFGRSGRPEWFGSPGDGASPS